MEGLGPPPRHRLPVRPPAPALLVLAALLLPGCLETAVPGYEEARREADSLRAESAALDARLAESRETLARSQALLEETAGELRAASDARAALENRTAALEASRDALDGALREREERLANASARLADAEGALATARADLADVAARLAEAEKVTADDRTLQQLAGDLAAAQAHLAELERRYDAAVGGSARAFTEVRAGNLTWHFTDLRGDARAWRYPMEEYRDFVKRSRPMDHVHLTTKQGHVIRVADPRPYVTPSVFADTARELTEGRSDRDFVREAFHFKRQLVVYQFSPLDLRGFYKYPAETLAEGTGVCGDTTVLLASLLLAGDAHARYGLTLGLWIVQWDAAAGRLVQDPEQVNHAFLEVRFADGETWYVETTTLEPYLHERAHGWRYDVAPDVEQRAAQARM